MLSLHTGYDTAYLTDAVGNGDAATDYYTAATGEPPGYWQGAGARALGLDGPGRRRGDAAAVPRGRRPGRAGAGQAAAAGEVPGGRRVAVRADRGRGGRAGRPARPVLHAGGGTGDPAPGAGEVPDGGAVLRLHVQRAQDRCRCCGPRSWPRPPKRKPRGTKRRRSGSPERAAQVRGAVKRANDRMMAVAEREAAYVRTGPPFGHVGGVPRRRGLHRRPASSSTTAGTAMPQLHVHNAIANRARALDGADDKWRALHGHAAVPGNGSGSARWGTGSSPRSWSYSATGPCSARTARRSRSAGSATRPPTRSLPGRRN